MALADAAALPLPPADEADEADAEDDTPDEDRDEPGPEDWCISEARGARSIGFTFSINATVLSKSSTTAALTCGCVLF